MKDKISLVPGGQAAKEVEEHARSRLGGWSAVVSSISFAEQGPWELEGKGIVGGQVFCHLQ